LRKVKPHPDYPTEEGRYLRGNDFSPVAVAIILNQDEDKIPPEIQALVRAGWESGAALSGTIQTPNIGFEKMISNLIANPNVRYLILGGPESAGHRTGEALKALFLNGVDAKKRIMGTEATHAALFNLPMEAIKRFLKQLSLIDLQFGGGSGGGPESGLVLLSGESGAIPRLHFGRSGGVSRRAPRWRDHLAGHSTMSRAGR
jgi:tetrahydromethanopterin S-methyltransferase subunit A